MLTANHIRRKYLDFFVSKGHTEVASDSLVPKDDPTVLFTTAGMQQFKPQFMGHIDGYTRATSSQKCMRTDDLDEVGKTDFHHTFFEMLGNFSFGDYFKKEAIAWAWEFLTKVLGLPAEKLWVSVYKDDDEAYQIWIKDIGFPAERIVKLGDKSNFWPSEAPEKGPNGPCGPCSEIYYDWGVGPNGEGQGDDPGRDPHGRFCEVWNLVFTQFNRKDVNVIEPLPSKNIDTGMGLERLTAVIQGKKNNFETDIFVPIMKAVSTHIGDIALRQKRVVADHIRGAVFGIADGVVPSNEGRGYVIKKLIIAMSDTAAKAGHQETVVYKLVPSVIEAMGEAYPELKDKKADIEAMIRSVETAYLKVLAERVPEVKTTVAAFPADMAEAELIEALGRTGFMYRDTYGLTVSTFMESALAVRPELSRHAARIEQEIERHMDKQREQSRASSKMQGDVFSNDLNLNVPKTAFLGYDAVESESRVLKIFLDGQETAEASKGSQVLVVLDKTPFYGESGGQIGDSGYLRNADADVRVTDTQKVNDIFLHTTVVERGALKSGDSVKAAIDQARRKAIMRNHTATHLMQSVLVDVLGPHVKQQGSLVAEDRLRFDFTHHSALTPQQIEAIESRVNAYINAGDPVRTDVLPLEEAKRTGAFAYFAEKYGDTVRVVSVDPYSKEFCGGTHVRQTNEIGALKITGESSVAQGIRRIEAVTGDGVDLFLTKQNDIWRQRMDEQLQKIHDAESRIREAGETVPTRPAVADDLKAGFDVYTQHLKLLDKLLNKVRFHSVKGSLDDILARTEDVDGVSLIVSSIPDSDMGQLRQLSDLVRQKVGSSYIIVLGGYTESSGSLLIAVSDDLVSRGIRADELIKPVAQLINGSGGGRPQMAQAGSKHPSRVPEALDECGTIIKGQLTR